MTARLLLTRAMTALLACAPLAGCAVGDDRDDATVAITIDRQSGRSWTAAGSPVDRGEMCAAGSQRLVDVLDLDGSPITIEDAARRRKVSLMAFPPDLTTDHLSVMQFSCADGTGAFTLVAERRMSGPWYVRDGTGTYRQLTGSGTVLVERDPRTDADDPPGGVPHYDHFTGTIEVRDDLGVTGAWSLHH